MKRLIAYRCRVQITLFLAAFLVQLVVNAQVVPNGLFTPGGGCDPNAANIFAIGCVPSWSPSHGVPTLRPGGSVHANATPAKLNSSIQGYSEGVYTQLSLVAGQRYKLSFYGSANNGTNTDQQVATLVVSLTHGLMQGSSTADNNTPYIPPPDIQELSRQTSLPRAGWVKQTVNFMAPTWTNPQLWIYSTISSGRDNTRTYGVLADSILIVPICSTPDVYYQNTSSLPPETRTRGSIYAGSAVTTSPVTLQYPNYAAFYALGQIVLFPGFSVEGPRSDGAEIFRAEVFPCAPPQTLCDCMSLTASRTVLSNKGTATVDLTPPSLFPNPTEGKFEFRPEKIEAENAGHFLVYDITGREVKTVEVQKNDWQSGSISLDVSSLSNGLYHYQFISGSYSVNGRFAVQK